MSDKKEKVKKLVIETDGTTAGTKIKINGEILPSIQRMEFSADASETYPKILLEKAMLDGSGKPKMRKVSLRDNKTEKFKDSSVVVTEPFAIEFERKAPAKDKGKK